MDREAIDVSDRRARPLILGDATVRCSPATLRGWPVGWWAIGSHIRRASM
jgi:hypothetical protein